ncbi:MAG: HlyD family efflux transporter periplasmic adaptor subunit [Chlorobi bacterium]|nr:HlyD family efflux transporter periplasmic adaptor subunit [Chlorobiota bacterium]
MKNKTSTIAIILLIIFASCTSPGTDTGAIRNSKAQVKTASIKMGSIPDNLVLSGKTTYLNKTSITSPITGYVSEVDIKPGSHIHKGDVLFKIMTQEAFMLKSNDSLMQNFRPVRVYSPVSGIVNQLDVVKKSVFIDKNSALCSIVDVNDLQVKAEVPFEYRKLAEPGKHCVVLLPDGTEHKAVFYNILPEMNTQSQTMKVLVQIESQSLVPENMIVRVLIDENDKTEKQILPKSCILSDELMKGFWVMKMINDSTAVKTRVEIGKQNHEEAEIISPAFNKNDKIISSGGYGLTDTSLVEIAN